MNGASSASDIDPILGDVSMSQSMNIGSSYGYGLIGGRLGHIHNRTLFYAKSGAVFTTTQTDYQGEIQIINGSFNGTGRSNEVGYVIGGGIEQALPPEWFKLAKNVSIKAEYLYLGTGRTQTVNVDLHWTGGATSVQTTDHISGIHTAKLGINYRF